MAQLERRFLCFFFFFLILFFGFRRSFPRNRGTVTVANPNFLNTIRRRHPSPGACGIHQATACHGGVIRRGAAGGAVRAQKEKIERAKGGGSPVQPGIDRSGMYVRCSFCMPHTHGTHIKPEQAQAKNSLGQKKTHVCCTAVVVLTSTFSAELLGQPLI